MTLALGAVVLTCRDLDLMRSFWVEALRLSPGPVTDHGRFQILTGQRIHLSLQVCDTQPTTRGHVHLDLFTSEQAAEIRRLIDLGATVVRHHREIDDDYVVMDDPEGNPFCVCAIEEKGDG